MKAIILQQLKLATREQHTLLERQIPLLDSQLSRKAYQHLLRRFYSYYAPLEMQLLTSLWWDEIDFDYTPRYKTPHLARDLIALGDTPASLAQLPFCQHLPDVTSLPSLLGCLYVIEGATLGGQVITQHLQANLGLTAESGSSFFYGYGAQTSAYWRAVCALLTRAADREDCDSNVLIATANQTFQTLGQWLFPKESIGTAE
jgi:heme oxygenase